MRIVKADVLFHSASHCIMQHVLRIIDVDQQEMVFMRVPGHVDIRGNKVVDTADKEDLDKEPTNSC